MLSTSVFTVLALGAYIFIIRRASSREKAPGLSAGFRLLLGTVFVCAAFSTAAGLSVLIAAAQVLVVGYVSGDVEFPREVSPWAMFSSYLLGNLTTVLVFHRVMSWHFGNLSGVPGSTAGAGGRAAVDPGH